MRQLLALRNCRLGGDVTGEKISTDRKEVHSGSMSLLQAVGKRTHRIPVHVTVYRNCFEHYAVISKDQLFCQRCMFVSLKNCFVLPGDGNLTELRIITNDYEGNSITLDTEDEEVVSDWMEALQSDSPPGSPGRMSPPSHSPSISRIPILQTLTESDEGE